MGEYLPEINFQLRNYLICSINVANALVTTGGGRVIALQKNLLVP